MRGCPEPARMKKMKTDKSFIVIGLGRFGLNVARILSTGGADVIGIDLNPNIVAEAVDLIPHCAIADATNIDALRKLGAEAIDHAVVAIGNNLQNSVLTLINLKKLKIGRITVRADDEDHAEVFRALGANEVIIPEESSAVSLGYQIMSDSVLDYYKVSENYAMVQISVGKGITPFTLEEMDVRNRFDINIIGFIKNEDFILAKGSDLIEPGLIVVAVGTRKKLFEFDRLLNGDGAEKKFVPLSATRKKQSGKKGGKR
jgi:trk system potassium uptake protein TrkA